MTTDTFAIIISILSSTAAAAAWITSRFAKLEIEVKHAFLRISALEAKAEPQPPTARRRGRQA